MDKKTMDMLKIGGAMMAVGTAAAVATGAKKMKSPKRTVKKLAKKSAKAMDGIMNNMSYMFK